MDNPEDKANDKPEEPASDKVAETEAIVEVATDPIQARLEALERKVDTIADEILADILIGEDILDELEDDSPTEKREETTETIAEQEPEPAYVPPTRKRHWA
jgi:hypothetical protein